MNENQIINISIIFGMTGIIILFLISEYAEIEETPLNEINENKLDEKIRINGKVKNIIEKNTVTLITIENSCNTLVVSFDDVLIKEGDNIELIGTVREYKGNAEVVAEKIRKV